MNLDMSDVGIVIQAYLLDAEKDLNSLFRWTIAELSQSIFGLLKEHIGILNLECTKNWLCRFAQSGNRC
jgi:hypothetical protein